MFDGLANDVPDQPAIDLMARALPRWLDWVGLAALGVLIVLWMRPSHGAIEPRLSLTNTGGRVTYAGLVKDDATRRVVNETFAIVFGEGNVSGDLQVDANVRAAPWGDRLGDIATALRVPGVEFSFDGQRLRIGGWLSAGDRQGLAASLAAVFGSQTTIGPLANRVEEAVLEANSRAESALAALVTVTATGEAIVRAMNFAVIDFAPGSADLPPDSGDILARSAEALKRAPKGTRVRIAAHTDNAGEAAANLKLSQARADSVKRALVAAGADPRMLIAIGYGDTKPTAPNDSEYGRFQNRRIEYSVIR